MKREKYDIPTENWETPAERLVDEFRVARVVDNTGVHLIKEKDLSAYVKNQIDDWFFGGDSMGAELVLGEDTSDSWMW